VSIPALSSTVSEPSAALVLNMKVSLPAPPDTVLFPEFPDKSVTERTTIDILDRRSRGKCQSQSRVHNLRRSIRQIYDDTARGGSTEINSIGTPACIVDRIVALWNVGIKHVRIIA
jgi:hypothetical protein